MTVERVLGADRAGLEKKPRGVEMAGEAGVIERHRIPPASSTESGLGVFGRVLGDGFQRGFGFWRSGGFSGGLVRYPRSNGMGFKRLFS